MRALIPHRDQGFDHAEGPLAHRRIPEEKAKRDSNKKARRSGLFARRTMKTN
jgi:hypothetical protein